MKINYYSMKVKKLVDLLPAIGAPIKDDDLVSITLNGLGKEYHQFWTSIGVVEIFLDCQELVALQISEEQRNGTIPDSAFYLDSDRGRQRGRGGRLGGQSRNQNQQDEQNYGGGHDNSRCRDDKEAMAQCKVIMMQIDLVLLLWKNRLYEEGLL